MNSFIKIFSSNKIQRTFVFFGILLVFFFIIYIIKKYNDEWLNTENMSGMTFGTVPEYIAPPPPPPPSIPDVPIAVSSPVISSTPIAVSSPVISSTPTTSSTVQVIQVVA